MRSKKRVEQMVAGKRRALSCDPKILLNILGCLTEINRGAANGKVASNRGVYECAYEKYASAGWDVCASLAALP